jgi:DNA-binding HxlR family transcriptional regulator
MPTVMWKNCPIRSSLGVLGRHWSLLILRDVWFFRKVRFSDMLRTNTGLSPRLLSVRLKELQKEGLIERAVSPDDHREVWYNITAKGRDVVPILSAFIQYGAKHRAKEVFTDRRPREFGTLFPEAGEFMLGPMYEYARSTRTRGRAGTSAVGRGPK